MRALRYDMSENQFSSLFRHKILKHLFNSFPNCEFIFYNPYVSPASFSKEKKEFPCREHKSKRLWHLRQRIFLKSERNFWFSFVNNYPIIRYTGCIWNGRKKWHHSPTYLSPKVDKCGDTECQQFNLALVYHK